VVEVRLVTKEHWSLTSLDLTLARQISAIAKALGVRADPDHTRTWEFTLDALDVDKVRRFWCAVLGYKMVGDSDIGDPDDLYPPHWRPAAPWSATGSPRCGGLWPTPRATRSTSPPGSAATEHRSNAARRRRP
jgi:Glyoxalase-like domain